MKAARARPVPRAQPRRGQRHSGQAFVAPKRSGAAGKAGELARLRAQLVEANETLRAIRHGEVDAVVVVGKLGRQVFTLQGAGHAYRTLIESMNEGALTLTTDKTIIYANQRFAQMVKCPLAQVIGGSFRRFLSVADRMTLRPLMKRAARTGAKLLAQLRTGDGSQMPVQISIRKISEKWADRPIIGMVVSDLTEARRSEEMLRALTQRVVQVQEAERGSVALDLHDHITQQLIAVLFSSQALSDRLSTRDGPAKREAVKLRVLLGRIAEEVERISRNLRPSILAQMGLFAVLRATGREFAQRTGLDVKLAGGSLTVRLPAETELALYRIFQEALKNIERHARARQVTVSLKQGDTFVQLVINDDGIGFDARHHAARQKKKGVIGLLGMHERAAYVGGALTVKSGNRVGTEIEVRIPLPPGAAAAQASA